MIDRPDFSKMFDKHGNPLAPQQEEQAAPTPKPAPAPTLDGIDGPERYVPEGFPDPWVKYVPFVIEQPKEDADE